MLVPIGISIAWGLVFGTFLTLAVLPVVLGMMKNKNDIQEEALKNEKMIESEKAQLSEMRPVLLAE